MIKVLLFGAISIINGVASDDKPITLSQHHDTLVSLEPHESYHQLNVKDGYLWNSNHGRQNIINQENILPWVHQKQYSDSFTNKHDNDYGHLLPFTHLDHKIGADYPNDDYQLSSALPMKIPILSNHNNFFSYRDELYKSNSHYLETHQGYRHDDQQRYDHENTKQIVTHEKLNFPTNNIYNRNHDIGSNLHGHKLNPPQYSPKDFKHNTPEELPIRLNHYNPYLARKIDYEYLNHGDPYHHRYLGTPIAEEEQKVNEGKYNHNSHIAKSENHVNPHNEGYSTPYINPNLNGNNFNNFNNYEGYRPYGTYLGQAPQLPGDVQSPIYYQHPFVNHGTGTRYLHHGYSHDDHPRQAYRNFKDVAVAMKDLIHQKNIYNTYINAYDRYHAHPRLRHYGRNAHTETVGNLMPYKERSHPYILPEYRRYNFNNEHGIKY